MSMKIVGTLALLAGVYIFAACSKPAVPGTPKGTSDSNIVSLLAIANQSEINEAKLAQERATTPEVKALATQMIQEHSAMLNEGQSLSKALLLPPIESQLGQTLVQEHQNAMRMLREKQGRAFDEAYLDHEIRMHQHTIALVETARAEVDRTLLRQFLDETQPKLQRHLQHARDTRMQG